MPIRPRSSSQSGRSHMYDPKRPNNLSSARRNRILLVDLPREQLHTVLSFLVVDDIFSFSVVGKFCHQLCKAIPVLISGKHMVTDRDIVNFSSLFRNVLELRLYSTKMLTAESMDKIPTSFSKLTVLILRNCQVPESTLQSVAQNSVRLRTLELSGCSFWSPEHINKLSNLQKLIDLRLGGCRSLTDSVLESLLCELPCLRSLLADGCTGLVSPQLRSTTLQRLLMPQCANLSAPTFDLPRLRALDISSSRKITDQVLYSVISGCVRLRFLKANACNGLTSLNLNAPHLYGLELSLCSRLTSLSLTAPKLCKLRMGTCGALTQLKLHLHSLHDLDLSVLPLRHLTLTAPALHNLNLAACDQLSTLSLTLPHLRTATVCRVPLVLLQNFSASVYLLGFNFIRKRGVLVDCIETGDSQRSRESYFDTLRSEAEVAARRAIAATGAPAPPLSYLERTNQIGGLGGGGGGGGARDGRRGAGGGEGGGEGGGWGGGGV